jgi:hypothetical protein
MKIAKTVAALAVVSMAAILVYGFVVGDFGGEGQVLLSMPWGIVSLVDVYIGFVLFSGWIVYRERSAVRSTIWVILVMILGNLTTSLYVLIALLSSRGDWGRFWMGNRLNGRQE